MKTSSPARFGLAVGVGTAVMLVLAGCVGTGPPTASRQPPTSSTTPSPSAPVASSAPSATPSAPPVATPCPATAGSGIPAGAISKKTIDVDNDGKVDTEWIKLASDGSTRFGVTTASGATFSYSLTSASPISREGFVASLGGLAISLMDDGRGAYIHVIVNCRFVQPLNVAGQPYTFDLQNLRGNGTGVGCSADSLLGYKATQTASGYTVTQRIVNLSADGLHATNGALSTIATNVPITDPRVKAAETVTCGIATMANAGVSTGG